MKPINEIRIRLGSLVCCILIPLLNDYYPYGSGWSGFFMMILVCLIGISVGCFITSLLIAFKKWWKE